MPPEHKNETHAELLQAIIDLEEKQAAAGNGWPADVVIEGYELRCTCPACPEQYDVFDSNDKPVGYLRLRHGWFRADYPHCGAETIYEAHPLGDGMFEEHERAGYLNAAIKALDARIKKEQSNDNS